MRLEVDRTNENWRQVQDYLTHRIAALSETCTSCASSDADRRAAAERIDELRTLLSAPTEPTREKTAPMATY